MTEGVKNVIFWSLAPVIFPIAVVDILRCSVQGWRSVNIGGVHDLNWHHEVVILSKIWYFFGPRILVMDIHDGQFYWISYDVGCEDWR